MKYTNSKSLETTDKSSLLYNPIFHILLVVIFGFIVYSNTFHVPFQFDDNREILENPIIKNLEYFINLSTLKTRYVGYLTFALNYALHGIDVAGYHIFNLAVHVVNALLIYWLVILSFRTPTLKESSLKDSSNAIAFFSALLFVCHPVQTQAVTYIVQRLASLATLFYLLSIVSYSKARVISHEVRSKAKSLFWYGVSLCSAVLAMKTKEISFTLPVVITLYEFMFFNGNIKRRILYLLPLFLTMLIIPLSLIGISKPLGDIIGDVSEATRLETNISRWDYLFTQFRIIVTYIRLIFLPINQNLVYDYPVSRSFFGIEVFLSFLFLLSILILGIYLSYRYRKIAPHTMLISFGIFWFFIALSVESGIIPIVDVIYEHRIYLPSVGFFIALVTFVIGIRNRLKTVMPVAERAIIPMLIVTALILSGGTIHRNTIWKDEITLWSDVVKKSPNKAGPHNNLGVAYEKKGVVDKAIEQYQIVLARYPNNADAHHNLGIAFAEKGWIDKAIEQYRIALKLQPDYYDTHFNLGVAFFSRGLINEAIEQYQMALKLKPGFADAYVNLGIIYGKMGSLEKSIGHFQKAIDAKPELAEAHFNLGVALGKLGSTDRAVKHLRTAVKLKPNYEKARLNLADTLFHEGTTDQAIEQYQAVLKLNPENIEARYGLGNSYFAGGLVEQAIAEYQKILKLDPDNVNVHYAIGDALYAKGDMDQAIEQYETFLKLNSNSAEAHNKLGNIFFKKGRLENAIEHFQASTRLKPDFIEAHYNLGVSFQYKGFTDKAITQYQRAIRLNPKFAEAYENLGTAYGNKGLIDKAIEYFQIALRLDPQNPTFRGNLAKAYELKTSDKKSEFGAKR